jgi:microcystin-dependent protein
MAFPPLVNAGETIASLWGRQVVEALSPIGTVVMWAGDTAPPDWRLCRGDAVSRTSYSALYDMVKIGSGTAERGRFDLPTDATGTAVSTFRLPDLRGRYAFGHNQGGSYGQLGVGQTFGNKDTTGLPTHTHGGIDHLHDAGSLATGQETTFHTHTVSWGEVYQAWSGAVDNVDSFYLTPAGGGGFDIAIHKFNTAASPTSNQSVFHAHYVAGQTGGADRSLTTTPAGTDVTNTNLPPSVSLNFIIRAQ